MQTPDRPRESYSDIQPLVPDPGFSRTPPAAELPGFDPSNSPLATGGREDAPEPVPANARLLGLTKPFLVDAPRVVYRVRREGWVTRRTAARSRFRTITGNRGSSTPRILAGLDERRKSGMLRNSRDRAVVPRFNLRGL
jgi:hypothetical protein